MENRVFYKTDTKSKRQMHYLLWVVLKKSVLIILGVLGIYILNHLPRIVMKVFTRSYFKKRLAPSLITKYY